MDTQTPQHEKQEKSLLKKYCSGCFIIFLLFITLTCTSLFIFLKIPLTEYPYYLTDLCKNISEETSDKKFLFLLTDESGSPLRCKNIRIEQEIDTCIESPCPDFTVVIRLKSSKEGKIFIKKDLITKKIWDYFEPKPKLVLRDHKEYLFHAQGNYNLRMNVEQIFTSSTESSVINLMLKQKEEDSCVDAYKKRFTKNYCDWN